MNGCMHAMVVVGIQHGNLATWRARASYLEEPLPNIQQLKPKQTPQDLTDVTYTFENGRMKASAKRAFNTGDATDLALCCDSHVFPV